MRILGFSKNRNKLRSEQFTTFRFKRKDADWSVGERVLVKYKPRSPATFILGKAEIINKESRMFIDTKIRTLPLVTETEAVLDGFIDWFDMRDWLIKTYGINRIQDEPINKLTLRWIRE